MVFVVAYVLASDDLGSKWCIFWETINLKEESKLDSIENRTHSRLKKKMFHKVEKVDKTLRRARRSYNQFVSMETYIIWIIEFYRVAYKRVSIN